MIECKCKWIERRGDVHKETAIRALQANTLDEKIRIQSENGCRYSELFHLPYYDPVVMHVVDPMHNLMLGIAKHTFQVWINKNMLDNEKLLKLDKRMKKMKITYNLGRIPTKLIQV